MSKPDTSQCYLDPNPLEFSDHYHWAYLQPVSGSNAPRINLSRNFYYYRIGRSTRLNNISLAGSGISVEHCILAWDGNDDKEPVVVTDKSRNGTFINGIKIGKNRTARLLDGNIISFASDDPRSDNGGAEDHRYTFHRTATQLKGLRDFYRLGDRLGEGSFAEVYRAINRRMLNIVAVKQIKEPRQFPEGRKYISERLRALEEIKVMSRLRHPNICNIVTAFTMDKTEPFSIVLEYVDGGDLSKLMSSAGPLSEEFTRHIVRQACSALSYMHSENVCHRDLKPANILLTSENPPNVKISDFGLAKVFGNGVMLKSFCGTSRFMAPEIESGRSQAYSHLVDSWSMGVIMYDMLLQKEPLASRDEYTHSAIVTVDRMQLMIRGISPEGQNFVSTLLTVEAERRLSMKNSLGHKWLCCLPSNYIHTPGDNQALHSNTFCRMPQFNSGDMYNLCLTSL